MDTNANLDDIYACLRRSERIQQETLGVLAEIRDLLRDTGAGGAITTEKMSAADKVARMLDELGIH